MSPISRWTWPSSTRSMRATRLHQPESTQRPGVPRRGPLAGAGHGPAGDAARAPAGAGRGPHGLADHPDHQPAGVRLRLQSGELLSLCRDAEGVLRIVVVEVHNTHLERHLYTLRPRVEGPRFVASMDKAFYVSPFIDMEGQYTVHVQDDPTRLRIAINERQGDAPVLATSLVLERRRLSDRSVLRMLLRHPFVTQKTIGLIHWHAFHLWRRGIRFQRHGEVARHDRIGIGSRHPTPRGGSMNVRPALRRTILPDRPITSLAEKAGFAAAARIVIGRLTVVMPDGRRRDLRRARRDAPCRDPHPRRGGRSTDPPARGDRGRRGVHGRPVVVARPRGAHRAGGAEPIRPGPDPGLVAPAAGGAAHARPSGAPQQQGAGAQEHQRPLRPGQRRSIACSSTRR